MEIKVSVKDIPAVIEQLQKAEEKINNLQSKIDKAIEYVSKLNSKGRGCEIYWDIKKEILDILKEDK